MKQPFIKCPRAAVANLPTASLLLFPLVGFDTISEMLGVTIEYEDEIDVILHLKLARILSWLHHGEPPIGPC
jgi:hypothetical protein